MIHLVAWVLLAFPAPEYQEVVIPFLGHEDEQHQACEFAAEQLRDKQNIKAWCEDRI